MVTKEEERKALAKIKKIVESLGEDSYVATAFEGCFEYAEQNIEWDACFNWKERALSAEKTVDELRGKIKAIEAESENQIAQLKIVSNKLSNITISRSDIEDCMQILKRDKMNAEIKAQETASEIVKYADDPNNQNFKKAVRENRIYAKYVQSADALISKMTELYTII
ncbi:MAG: hypothetical protein MJY95_08235 [Bacteroidaceae bacterium]|nr:hypothetical protein [Bacteroidaceae bacterium]